MFYYENLYQHLIDKNITVNQLDKYTVITTLIVFIIAIICLTINYTSCFKYDEKTQIITAGVSMITTTICACMWSFLIFQTDNYTKYIDSNLKKYTYEVTSISKDKKSIHTKYGTFDNNSEDPMKTIEVPTTDKSKVGKTYYKVTVYRPQKFAKLSKHKNKLVKYKYIYSTPADK